jgi:hypothetical protein
MSTRPQRRTKVFIYHSVIDLISMEHFWSALMQAGVPIQDIQVWESDQEREPDPSWQRAPALDTARVVILLVSQSFLASEITDEAFSGMLLAAQERGTRLLPILLSPSTVQATRLSHFPAFNSSDRPFSTLDQQEQREVWLRLASEVRRTLRTPYPL